MKHLPRNILTLGVIGATVYFESWWLVGLCLLLIHVAVEFCSWQIRMSLTAHRQHNAALALIQELLKSKLL